LEQIRDKTKRLERANKQNVDQTLLLHKAAYQGDLLQLSHLLEHCNIDPNAFVEFESQPALQRCKYTALHWAARTGNSKCVHFLLENGALAHIKDHRGKTALHYTILCNQMDVIELLVKEQGNNNILTLNNCF
jgi:ankyrin repeat protein